MASVGHRYSFKSPARVGNLTRILVGASAAWSVISAALSFGRLHSMPFVIRIVPGEAASFARPTPIPQALSFMGSLLSLATVVVWLMWQYRVTENIWAHGIDVKITPAWAVGWWFIPIANLWKPAIAMYRVDRATLGPRDDRGWLVGAWWTAYRVIPIVGGIIAFATLAGPFFRALDSASQTPSGALTIDLTSSMHAFAPWSLVGALVRIPAGLLAIALVTRIDRAQDALGPWVPERPDLALPGMIG
jgi:hypothetical protein